MKLLISIVGFGKYEPVIIKMPWCPDAEISKGECYHQEALRRALQPDYFMLAGTVEAKEKHGVHIPNDQYVLLTKGTTEDEFWAMFSAVTDAMDALPHSDDGWDIHLDLTHGFRVQPMFLSAAVRYLCKLNSQYFRLAEVYYNLYEHGHPESPLLQATAIVEMENVAQDVNLFLSYSVADPLYQRLHRLQKDIEDHVKRPLMAEGLAKKQLSKAIGQAFSDHPEINILCTLCNKLKAFSAMIGTNYTPDAAEITRSIYEVADEAEACFRGRLRPLGQALGRLRRDLNALLPEDKKPLWIWHAALAKWCLERRLYQQALTHANELIVTRACEEAGRNPLNKEDRECSGPPLHAMHKDDSIKTPEALKPLLNAWSTVVDARNAVNHACTNGSSESTMGPDQLSKHIADKVVRLLDENAKLTGALADYHE
ncbi:MAG: CRISPR-associated DxTHG motif protein [Spartobacteria bacterium]|nr:CRISPR-associated DxTHG motif protein [Spartobacteria bacterium]